MDPLEAADFRRKQIRESFACRTCGSPDPAIIEGRYCSDCTGDAAIVFEAARAHRRRQIIVESGPGYIVTAEVAPDA